MTRAHRRYLLTETAIAAVINAVLSLLFVLLVFGGRAEVPVSGSGGVIPDALPQGFMVALMSCLVPTLLTRHRVATGRIPGLSTGIVRPQHALLRALAVAVPAALVAWGLQATILPFWGTTNWHFTTVLAFKCVFGAMLGAVVSALSARAALADALPAKQV